MTKDFRTGRSSGEPAPVPWLATLRGRPLRAVFFDLDGTLIETDDETVARLARRLTPLRPLLPRRDVARTARHLADWINERFNGGLAVLDWLRLDEPAQRLVRRWGLIHANSAERPLVPVAGTIDLVQALYGRYLLGIVSTRSEALPWLSAPTAPRASSPIHSRSCTPQAGWASTPETSSWSATRRLTYSRPKLPARWLWACCAASATVQT